MPAILALFDGAPDRPRQEARDLVAYLESLGRARELAGPEGEAHAREGCDCPDDEMAQMAFRRPPSTRTGRGRCRTADAPSRPSPANPHDPARGQRLFGDHCATCHGATGAGDGPGARRSRPAPANLAEHEYIDARLVGRAVERRGRHRHAGVARLPPDGSARPWPPPCRRSRPSGPSRPCRTHLVPIGRAGLHRQLRAVPRRARRRPWIGGRRAAHGAHRLPAQRPSLAEACACCATAWTARRWRRGRRG